MDTKTIVILLSISAGALALRLNAPIARDDIVPRPKISEEELEGLMKQVVIDEAAILNGTTNEQDIDFARVQPGKELALEGEPGAKCGVIWLHGIGGKGADGKVVSKYLQDSGTNCLLAFPRPAKGHQWFAFDSPKDCATVPGFCMPKMLTPEYKPPYHGVKMSQARKNVQPVHKAIEKLMAQGIPAHRIVIGGFSMGGAEALLSALSFPSNSSECALRENAEKECRLGGAMVISSAVPSGKDKVHMEVNPIQEGMSIFAAHGKSDNQMSHKFLGRMVNALDKSGFNVTHSSFDGSHELNKAVAKKMVAFVESRMQAE